MALFFADLVRETCWASGAGDLALGGALPGHRTFAAAVPSGARFHYAICGITRPEEWETGEGEITGGALARIPIASSSGGAAVAFSAGLKTVALAANAAWFESQEAGAGIADVEGLTEALAGKAAAGHDHDGAYQPADAELSAIAALTTTAFGRAQLELADAATARANLGLGSAAVKTIGTSGDAVPLLNGGPTSWAAGATFGGSLAGALLVADHATQPICDFRIAGASNAQIVGGPSLLTSYVNTWEYRLFDSTLIWTSNAGGLSLAPGKTLSVNGTQVVTARQAGWTAATGNAARGSFDTASVTTAALAERVKALIDDLTAHGLIGS